jgi:WD40 repeat protein
MFSGKGTCTDIVASSAANQGRVIAVGFDNGLVRVLLMGEKNWDILKAFKAHETAVMKVKFSPDQTMLATCSANGDIFFF